MRKCKNCGGEISSTKDYRTIFCSHSCSASFNNLGRVNLETTKKLKRQKNLEWCIKNGMNVVHSKSCKYCNVVFNYKTSRYKGRTYCSVECRKLDRRKHLDEFNKYKRDCQFRFNFFQYPNEFNISLVEKYGLYSAINRGNNLNGVSRDHQYSIFEGFKNKVDSKLISHPANCRLVLQNVNSKKHSKSIITIKELISRIDLWNKKYGGIV